MFRILLPKMTKYFHSGGAVSFVRKTNVRSSFVRSSFVRIRLFECEKVGTIFEKVGTIF